MFKKHCPFCNTQPVIEYDKFQYRLYCKKCQINNIQINIYGNTEEEVISKWNNRVLDNEIVNNPEKFLKITDNYNNNFYEKISDGILKRQDFINLFSDTYSLNKITYGYLVLLNGRIINCKDSHGDEVLKLVNLPTGKEFDCENVCIRSGILRICMDYNCIMIVIPNKTSKIQLEAVFNILTELSKENFKAYCVFVPKNEDYKVESFTNLNELYLYLDKIIKFLKK